VNKKNPDKIKNYTVVLRLTKKEKEMVGELRQKYNLNLSSLMRNTIIETYRKMSDK